MPKSELVRFYLSYPNGSRFRAHALQTIRDTKHLAQHIILDTLFEGSLASQSATLDQPNPGR